LPAKLNGIPFVPGRPAAGADIDEPAFTCATGLKPAAGVVIEETDVRFWLVAPTNQVGGYAVTFPKGRPVPGASLQQTARCEAWEESGLVVALATFLCDVPRSQSFTRYDRARRMGGTPSAMGWESQAVLLVSGAHLRTVACHPNDQYPRCTGCLLRWICTNRDFLSTVEKASRTDCVGVREAPEC